MCGSDTLPYGSDGYKTLNNLANNGLRGGRRCYVQARNQSGTRAEPEQDTRGVSPHNVPSENAGDLR